MQALRGEGMRAVYVLIALNVLLWAFGFNWPLREVGPDLLLYSLTHAAWWHLAFNMVALLTFGLGIERQWGWLKMLVAYAVCVMGGALLHLASGDTRLVVGSSGGVLGLMAIYSLLNPQNKIEVLLLRVPAWIGMIFMLLVTILCLLTGWIGTVAHWVHLGGMLAGMALVFDVRWEERRNE